MPALHYSSRAGTTPCSNLRVLVAAEEIASFHHLPVLVVKPSQAVPLIHGQWLEEEEGRQTPYPTESTFASSTVCLAMIVPS